MGAIVGVFSLTNKKFLSQELLEKMCNSMSHRGPDGQGTFISDDIMLGHNRFTTIGLGEVLKQPIFNREKSLALVFNGAIYNYKNLRIELESKGYKFFTTSDAEVILPLFEEYGFDFVKYIDGMFALAIYNIATKQLFIARDRTGEKPLYYAWYQDTFFFGSEIKAFWNIPNFSPNLSKEGVFNYFLFTQCPAPFTLYEGIKKLMPSYYMIVEGNGKIVSKPYWKIDFAIKTDLSFSDAKEKLEEELTNAIKRTMTSDVPVDALLSGGVDSSTIVGIMSKLSNTKIKTFTIGKATDENSTDPEFGRAERIATKYDTEHHIVEYKKTSFEDFCYALKFYDEPVGIFDSIQQLYLNKYIKGHSRVILSGTAADTILAEPVIYPEVRERYTFLQRTLVDNQDKKRQIDRIIADTQNIIQLEQAEAFMPENMVEFAKSYDAMDYLSAYFEFGNYDDMWGAELFIEYFVYFSHISTFNDNIGMTNGVEVRAPFLDHHLLEFASTLPESYIIRMRDGQREQKYILKEIAKKYMPEDMVYAPKIMCGQYIDWIEMMKTIWRQEVDKLFELTKIELSDFISYEKIQSYWTLFQSNQTNFRQSYNFLRIVMFLIWYRENYSKKDPNPGFF